MRPRRIVVATLTGASLALVPVVARAQGQTQLSITTARRDTLALDSSSAVTAVFRVKNASRDTVIIVPSLALPRGWEPLIGPPTLRIGPGATELWITGVHAPSSAAAGTVVIRGAVGPVTDSVLV